MSQYGSKTAITLVIKKEEATAALVELRKEWAAADIALGAFIKRLQWFRMWKAYKYFGHSTFEQFLKAEIGRSRKWLWRHLKTLPIEADERRLLGDKSGTRCPNENGKNGVPDSAKADCGNIGNVNIDKLDDGLKLTHGQRLEIAKIGCFVDSEKALAAVMAECPGANLETTRAVIEKTIGKPKAASAVAAPRFPSIDKLVQALRETLKFCKELGIVESSESVNTVRRIRTYVETIQSELKTVERNQYGKAL